MAFNDHAITASNDGAVYYVADMGAFRDQDTDDGSVSSCSTQSTADARSVLDDDVDGESIDEIFGAERAREVLKDTLANVHFDGISDEQIQTVLEVLRKYPKFAETPLSHCFQEYLDADDLMYPFVHLLVGGAGKPVLEEVYKMFPRVLLIGVCFQEYRHVYAVTLGACLQYIQPETVRFMAEMEPEALKTRSPSFLYHGSLPIHTAIRANASKSAIQILLEVDPDCVTKKDRMTGPRDCLSLVCSRRKAKDDVVALVAETLGRQKDSYTIKQPLAERLYRCKALPSFLAQLSKIIFACSDWSHPINDTFFAAMGENQSTRRLKLVSEAGDGESHSPSQQTSTMIESFLKQNKGLDNLEFVGQRDQPMELILRGILEGLAHNQTVEFLNIDNVWLPNSSCLGLLLSSCPGLAFVSLKRLHIADGTWLQSPPHPNMTPVLNELSLTNLSVPGKCLEEMLFYLAKYMVKLEFLQLSGISFVDDLPSVDFTEAALAFVSKDVVQWLSLGNLDLDVERVCVALMKNTSIVDLTMDAITKKHEKCFVHLLYETNTSLQSIGTNQGGIGSLPFSCNSKELLHFYMRLNDHGRGEARSDDVTLPAFVDLLCRPILEEECDCACIDDWHEDPLNLLNIHYCLLQQKPNVWSLPSND